VGTLNTPLRVLWLVKGLGRGGTEQLLCSSIRHLDRQRFEVEVAYVLPWKSALVATLEAEGVPVHCLGGTGLGALRWPLRLRSLVRRRRFDLVHTHSPAPAVMARGVLRPSKPLLLHTEHNMWPRARFTTRWTNAVTLWRNAHVLAVSQAVADTIRRPRVVPKSVWPTVEVAYQGIEGDRVRSARTGRTSARRLLGLGEEELVVGTVGNLTAKKDQRSLLDALARLAAEHPHLRGVIIGLGPLEEELKAHAQELGLGDKVLFCGLRDDVPDVLPALDVFVLSSLFEGLPIALIEAMATGLACVATSVGGVPELVTDASSAVLVPPRSVDAMVDAIGALLADPGRRQRMGDAAATVGKTLDIAAAVKDLEATYERLAAGADA